MKQSTHVKLFASLAAALAWAVPAYSGQHCTIVIDGGIDTFIHERAHCLGWTHILYTSPMPGPEWWREYDGPMTVIATEWIDDLSIRFLQPSAEVRRSKETAASLCSKLWAANHIDYSVYAGRMDQLRGCSVKD